MSGHVSYLDLPTVQTCQFMTSNEKSTLCLLVATSSGPLVKIQDLKMRNRAIYG
jgi:hypothetical protein